MIFINEELLQMPNKLQIFIEEEKKYINYYIESQHTLKEILLNFMQEFGTSTECVIEDDFSTLLKFLEDLKNSLILCNDNIMSLKKILSEFDNICSSIFSYESLKNFSGEYSEIMLSIMKNTMQIESCIFSISCYSKLKFSDSNQISKSLQKNAVQSSELPVQEAVSSVENPLVEPTITETYTPNIEPIKENYSSHTFANDISNTIKDNKPRYFENTLTISEMSGKVILPYNISSLEETLQRYPEQYSSLDEIIAKDYTLSIDLFKVPSISRFKEAFKLMRNKEKQSIKAAFDLGMELLFNYNLHPAIITACKNLDELDIYLDYLETGETNKFDFFNIVFEIAPKLVKNDQEF